MSIEMKITGLDELQKQLDGAAKALQRLDGEIGMAKFNPHDPSSVEAAVVQIEQTIDTKTAPYRGNGIVENLIKQLKEKYRLEIYDRAAKARSQADLS